MHRVHYAVGVWAQHFPAPTSVPRGPNRTSYSGNRRPANPPWPSDSSAHGFLLLNSLAAFIHWFIFQLLENFCLFVCLLLYSELHWYLKQPFESEEIAFKKCFLINYNEAHKTLSDLSKPQCLLWICYMFSCCSVPYGYIITKSSCPVVWIWGNWKICLKIAVMKRYFLVSLGNLSKIFCCDSVISLGGVKSFC